MKKTILVVDDEESMRNMLEVILDHFGYNAVICESGEEATTHINSADLLITDFHMPGITGADLVEITKSIKPIPAIIMTGTAFKIPANHKADEIVEKPFRIERLMYTITRLLS